MRKRPRADRERLDLLKQEEFMLTFCETVEARSSSLTALQRHSPFLGKEGGRKGHHNEAAQLKSAKIERMKQYLKDIWDQQHRCPGGIMGWFVGEQMVRQHWPETAWTLDLLDIQPADRILEVGFGAGRGVELAAKKAHEGRVMGIDLSDVMGLLSAR